MDEIEFIKVVNQEQANIVETLANEIWHEYYDLIIGKHQIDYMLEKFQSKQAILTQIRENSYYYLISEKNNYIGYLSFIPKERHLFLSKLYLKSSSRGKGYGRKIFGFIESFAVNNNLSRITLTVNKNNLDSINIYKKVGFNIVDSVVNDIGNGFYMNDYIFQKDLFLTE